MPRLACAAIGAAGLALLLSLVVTTGSAEPAVAQSADDEEFVWDDDQQEAAFDKCMEVVDWVANGADAGSHPGFDVPEGVDQGEWNDAINTDWLDWMHVQQFTYRPQCHLLLPDDWEDRIPSQFRSETFTRCQDAVTANEPSQENRPKVLPYWYWGMAMRQLDCHLLLPLGAFGLGDDQNAWSEWTAEDEVEYPDTHDDPDVVAEYEHCLEYIPWRMEHGNASFGGPGHEYDDPPLEASPKRVWHEAIDFYVDAAAVNHAGDEATLPADWLPNCELLLLYHPCDPNGEALVPETCAGAFASRNYDIGYSELDGDDQDEGEGDVSISRNMWGGTTGFAYFLGKGAIQVALWAVDWAFTFDISAYNALALDVGDDYQTRLLGHTDFHLRDLLWLILFAWAGFTALRGRLAMAGSEILLTVVLLLLSAVLMHQREVYMDATWNLMDKASAALLVAGMGGDPQHDGEERTEQLVEDLQGEIHHVFVEQTYDYLNWGQPLGDPDDSGNPLAECASTRSYILSSGPHGTDPWPRQQMSEVSDGACQELADFNRDPDGSRLLGAVLMMLSSIMVSVLLTLIALTIVLAQLVALLLFAVAPFATLVTILPGHGRRLAWSWATALVQTVITDIGMSFVLSLLLIALKNLMDLTEDVHMIEVFALMNLVVLVMFAARRGLMSSAQSVAARWSEHLSAPRGSGTSWAHAGGNAAGNQRGLNLLGADRAAAWAGYGPLVASGTTVTRRIQERRVARRGYRNLAAIAQWKRAENTRNARWIARRAAKQKVDPANPWTIPTRRQQLP